MYSLPDVRSGQNATGIMDTAYSARMEKRGISSYESMQAGLTIKTREGDVVTLSTSRFSELNAREYTSQGYVETQDGQAWARTQERSIELSTGETFSFSVKGDLNEQELADIESIISGIDGIIYEMAEGDMDEAIAQALSMGSYSSVAGYEADITVARSYGEYAETRTTNSGTALPDSRGGAGNLLPYAGTSSPFMGQISSLLEEQKTAALAQAREPLSQLFDYYLEAQAGQLEKDADPAEASGRSQLENGASPSPFALALESTAKMVDQLIREMVRDAFENTLDQVV